MSQLIEILLVEDNAADIEQILELFGRTKIGNRLSICRDGVEAMSYLHEEGEHANSPRPNLIFLDLNMPRKNGSEVLEEIMADPKLWSIPVVILTSSSEEEDIVRTYRLNASCYIQKPVSLEQLLFVIQSIDTLGIGLVELPQKPIDGRTTMIET